MQIKKLVQKVVMRDTLNYRKLTDKPAAKVKEGEEEEGAANEEKLDELLPDKDIVEIAQGMLHLHWLPKQNL